MPNTTTKSSRQRDAIIVEVQRYHTARMRAARKGEPFTDAPAGLPEYVAHRAYMLAMLGR